MSPDSFMVYFSIGLFLVVFTLVLLMVLKPRRKKDSDHSELDQASDHLKPLPVAKPSVEEEALPLEEELVQGKTLEESLSNTRQSFFGRLKQAFSQEGRSSSQELESLEEILYTSDLGPKTVQTLLLAVGDSGASGFEPVRQVLREKMSSIFEALPKFESEQEVSGLESIQLLREGPSVWMIVGVNGAGKTTTIGKLATKLASQGKRVLLAAGDTFRAAAGEQLNIWTQRAQVEIFHPPNVKDPSAVAYDAVQRGRAKNFDVVIVDTAGRLHTQKNLMEELKKMKRVIAKVESSAPHETLLVLDASSGQNALVQAEQFHQALGLTGVVLTKMDGTAKGGVALGVVNELKVPVKLIGIGEGVEDLRGFSPREYIDSIV